MKSLFKPEKSYGERFSKTSYLYTVKKLKIDPITEGAILRKKLEKLLWGNDFLELKRKSVREEKQIIAEKYIKQYYDRARKFWKVYQEYCFLKGQKRLLYDKWWLDERYKFGDVAFIPKHMAPEQLSEECFKARVGFYGLNSILKRFSNIGSNCGTFRKLITFFSLNIFSQHEAQKRQGLPLGEGLDTEK